MTDHFLLAQIVAVIIFHNSFVFIEVSFFFVFIEISFSKINLIVSTCRGVRMDLKNLPLSNSSHNFKTPFAVKTHIYRF